MLFRGRRTCGQIARALPENEIVWRSMVLSGTPGVAVVFVTDRLCVNEGVLKAALKPNCAGTEIHKGIRLAEYAELVRKVPLLV